MIVLYTTWPNQTSADACAEALVDARLAACVHMLAEGRSVYRWQGAVARDPETVMLIKTSAANAAAARELIESRHPYDLPCIIALPVDVETSLAPFLAWVEQETRQVP